MKYSKQDYQRLRNGMEMVVSTNRKNPDMPWSYRSFDTIARQLRMSIEEIEHYMMTEMSEYDRNHLYGTFYIRKGSNPEERTFSRKVAKSWGKTPEGKPRFREIQYLRNENLKKEVKFLATALDTNFTAFYNHIHGFSKGKGVITNILEHVDKGRKPKHLVNMDLENAFHQISAENVHDFAKYVLGWNKRYCHLLASLMTFNEKMVQGNPASPVLLNIFALLMDFRIIKFCEVHKELGLKYTRYADDLTITGTQWIPKNLINFITNTIIADSGFVVNPVKTQKHQTQLEITGVQFLYDKMVIKTMNRRKHKKALRVLNRMHKKGVKYWGYYPDDFPDEKKTLLKAVIKGLNAWLYPSLKKARKAYKKRNTVIFGNIKFKSKSHYYNYIKGNQVTITNNASNVTYEQLDMFQILGF